jgi:hypothetical protein
MSSRWHGSFLWMVLPLLAAGQERPRLFPPDSSSCTRIIAKGGYEMDANAIYNELLLGLVNGGYLERELRQRSSDALIGMNRLGQVFQVRATVIAGDSIFHQPGLQWSVSASHQDQGGMRFRPDVYDLTFFGNAAYEDRTADLSNSAYERQIFQTLGMGLYWGRTGDHVRLDLVKGQSLNAVELEDATLYTAPDGRRLDVRLHGDYLQSDTAVNGSDMRTWNGSGCALSFSYGYALGPENGSRVRNRLTASVEDLGLVSWNSASLRTQPDTSYSYEGLEVDNILDLDGAILGEGTLQDTLGLSFERGAYWRVLPYRAALRYDMEWRAGWCWAFTLSQRYLPGYFPLYHLEAGKHLGRHFLGLSAQYGGFGDVRAGLRAAFEMGPARLGLVLPNLATAFGKDGRGQTAQISLEACF